MSVRQTSSISALALLALLAACKGQPPANQAANNSADLNITEIPADEGAAANMSGEDNGTATGGPSARALIPPAPGEPGGLPDDRTPLNEKAARNPASVEASGTIVQLWGLALSDGRYADAYRLWAQDGKQSGMSEAQFAEAYRKYSEIHVLVGRPEAGGTQTARVPVQMYGRLKEGNRPFNLFGMMTLARNPKGQKGEPGEHPWLIAASELKPAGTVKEEVSAAGADLHVIPANFHGRWSQTQAACSKRGDMSRLTIYADTLLFYESQGKVTQVRALGPDEIRIDARYQGEGESWSRSSALRLSGNGLVVDGMKRVRCAKAVTASL